MFKNFTHYTNTIATHNEDACYSCEQFLFVIDGATGLFGGNFTDYESDSQWLSHTLKAYLIENLTDLSECLPEIVAQGALNAKKMFENYKKIESLDEYPSSSCSIVRINDDVLEYLTMADSPILIEKKDGEVLEIYENRLRELDATAIKKAVEIAKEKGISVKQARTNISEILQENRRLLNKSNGYHAISIDENAAFDAITGKIPLKEVKSVAILSDGFSQHYDVLQISKSPKEFLDFLSKKMPEQIFSDIIEKQKRDAECNEYPRFKISDDASIAVGNL